MVDLYVYVFFFFFFVYNEYDPIVDVLKQFGTLYIVKRIPRVVFDTLLARNPEGGNNRF